MVSPTQTQGEWSEPETPYGKVKENLPTMFIHTIKFLNQNLDM